MNPSVSVIIVNWNSGVLLKECLSALAVQTLQPTKIYVVDNGSTDNSITYATSSDNVTLISLGRNTGFAFANNIALSICETDYIALINPDAFADCNWLKSLVAAATMNPDFAAFGSRQMVHGSTELIDGIGDIYHISGLVWRNGYGRKQTIEDLKSQEIFSPCAGAVLYSREVLLQLGGFDEDFFCYVEDVDLGFRLRLAGYRSIYVPDAIVHHVGSAASGGHHSHFSIYHGHRNLVWAFFKNMPDLLLCLLLPLHIVMNIFTILYFFYKGKGRIILTAKYDAIKGLPSILKKRKKIQHNRKSSIADIWKALDKRIYPVRN